MGRAGHKGVGMQPSEGMRFVVETPETHGSRESQAFIQQEIDRPSKVWVQEVVRSDRESEFVKLRTEDFVLLPDLNGHRRQARAFRARPLQLSGGWPARYEPGWKQQVAGERGQGGWDRDWKQPQQATERDWKQSPPGPCFSSWRDGEWGRGQRRDGESPPPQHRSFYKHSAGEPQHNRARSWPPIEGGEAADEAGAAGSKAAALAPPKPARHRFNWLAIVADPSLRSVRDLRGEHVGMLERLYEQCVAAIQREYKGVGEEDIMVFANYPPSVYKLHFHFCAPFFQPTAYDAFRMHSLSAIINNLRIHPLYYQLSTLQIPVHSGSELYRAINEKNSGDAVAVR